MQGQREPDRLTQLTGWLAQGWQVESPILQRPILHDRSGELCVYEIVVCRGSERRVVALGSDGAVQAWLASVHLPVLYV